MVYLVSECKAGLLQLFLPKCLRSCLFDQSTVDMGFKGHLFNESQGLVCEIVRKSNQENQLPVFISNTHKKDCRFIYVTRFH